MNPLIKDQLTKIRKQKSIQVDESTKSIIIPRCTTSVGCELQEDGCYLISVEDYILNPPDGFTLHTNWNNNLIPKHKFMKIDVTQVMGKMIKVNSIGYDPKRGVDTGDVWSGWLPKKSISIIEVL